MDLYKKYFLIIVVLIGPLMGFGQELKPNLFFRTPQIVNYTINQSEVTYSPIISIGVGLSHKSRFIELATFISDDDVYGFYTFFGTTLKTKQLGQDLKLHTNWFGEITYVPSQNQDLDYFMYTSGVCFFLNHSFEWGSIGIPFCLGLAYGQDAISLNTRTVLNLSLNLK
ncbi:hypothetical protein [uncultured Croceitalea sp.]|uniref:hypothetical protein n=1 Tax=uncultured Croceitalea sp. TaxID=1798908 RepID=UPI0033066608